MTIEEALVIVKNKNERRFPHIVGTFEMASYLAEYYQEDVEKCQLAAIFHDYAKNEPFEVMREIIKQTTLPERQYLLYSTNIYHAPVARYYLETQFHITDLDILDAVEFHVTGHPKMNNIAKILFISDYIEKGRTHPSVDYCRYLSLQSLDLAVAGICEQSLLYLKSIDEEHIHPLLTETYHTFIEKVGEVYYESIKDNYKRL
jgi:predicted HD superfamily hydrolase involved in NAD metabolism